MGTGPSAALPDKVVVMHVTSTVWLHSLAIVVAAYLLGSIPTGYLLMRIFRRQDIRTLGSGNIGATNVLRSGAKGLGAATFLLDVLKGMLAVWVGAKIGASGIPMIRPHDAMTLAALCAVLGHMFPIWLGLKGGKGVATAFGVFIMLVPYAALGSLVLFIVVFAISRIVSLASILGTIVFPLLAWVLAPWAHTYLPLVIICLICGLILVKHQQNILRLMAGTEYRFGSSKKNPPPPTGAA
ncbi:glycerol-3-phosphate 1-O-acyltransferase PlsY [Acidicapsa dinghuensis]|uniref:Glycerol-3-phosphate acyltransferase n=1 Tax=Acidicapsa dinghuensis TaxID=2218256 RepID=A0ABW1EE03_9BACT|nr:glycerol-3-phosphate 1-O-acyltransferase PlsY [Acidicapsa dinghuensis]